MTFPFRRSTALAILLASSTPAAADDGFEKVKCGEPIVPALLAAQPAANQPVVKIEARRANIGLKNLGADMLENNAATISWEICGRIYTVLQIGRRIRDAVEVPRSSPSEPAFSGIQCLVGGRPVEGYYMGLFARAPKADDTYVPIKAGWEINLKKGTFIALPTDARCHKHGLIT